MVSARKEFVTATIRSAVVIVMLLIVRVVTARLPMLRDIMPLVNFDLASLLDAIVMTGVVIAIVAFGVTLERHLPGLVTGFPRAGQLSKLFAVIIAVTVAYFSYRYLVLSLIPDLDWLYPIVFLVLFAVPVVLLCVAIYASIDDLTALFTGGRRARPLPAGRDCRACAGCGAPLLEDAVFCASCGTKVEDKKPEPPEPARCPACGAEAAPEAKFCGACGQALGTAVSS